MTKQIKEKTDAVFVVLTYRNAADIEDFFRSLVNVKCDYRVVTVNSYYDDASTEQFRTIAAAHGAHFIAAENKGYGAGNNRGIEYALARFEFKHLIVSNPDVEIADIDACLTDEPSPSIYGPKIVTRSGKNQNPFYPVRSRRILRIVFKRGRGELKRYRFQDVIRNKFYRVPARIKASLRKRIRVFALHGAFLVFNYAAVSALGAFFDERMFLFGEEPHLAFLAETHGINTYYTARAKVRHKEDGSVKFLSADLEKICTESLAVLAENWSGKL